MADVNVADAVADLMQAQVRVAAGVRIPKRCPPEFVQVLHLAEVSDDDPVLGVLVRAPSWGEARKLAMLVRRRVRGIRGLEGMPVFGIRDISVLCRHADAADQPPSYQFAVQLMLRDPEAP